MGRTHLAPDAGMLFHFDEDAPRTMWMKNTLIPLDMLFISANGEILAIHEQARPGDLTDIDSPGPIRDVLEIAGGRARALGIGVGSRISVPNLIPAQAIN